MQDNNKNQAYRDVFNSVHRLEEQLATLANLYTDGYNELSWEERRPDIIKSLIEASKYIVTAKMLILECIMEEENVLNESMRKKYG